MSLTSSLLIGQTALAASQVAIQVTGNNLANAATPGYHRQRVEMSPVSGYRFGSNYLGRGVQVQDIRRMLDPALQARLRDAMGQEASADIERQVLDQIESLTNELTGTDLSTELGKFFNAFSELANNPASTVTRASVLEQGASLASYMRTLRADLGQVQTRLNAQLATNVDRADSLLDQIANLNQSIVLSEAGTPENGSLRDQRDLLVNELSQLLDVSVVEQTSGVADILVGSQPVVLGTTSRGLELRTRTVDGESLVEVVVSTSQEVLANAGGTIGAIVEQRDGTAQDVIDDLDSLASNIIFEVNRLHASGRPSGRLRDETGWLAVPVADRTLAFNDPTNETFADLPFRPANGSFKVIMRDANGNAAETTIEIDLDGINSTGVAGFGDDTTLDDIRAALDGIANLNAQITPDGRLRVYTDDGFDVSFSDDSSGVLAVLGINTYFQGTDASDIAVRESLRADPSKLVLGLEDGTNETALAIAGLRDKTLSNLGGVSLTQSWLASVGRVAVQASTAQTRVEALSGVRASLEAQNSAISGVSTDEESINLIMYQQQYQGAARFISVVNELTQVLLGLV